MQLKRTDQTSQNINGYPNIMGHSNSNWPIDQFESSKEKEKDKSYQNSNLLCLIANHQWQ